MVQSQPQPDDNSPVEEAAFEVTTQGLVVEVVITPHEESERPTAQAVVAALRSAPPVIVDPALVARELKGLKDASVETRFRVGEVAIPKTASGPCAVVVSHDRLRAYLIPMPPPPVEVPPGDDAGPAPAEPAVQPEAETEAAPPLVSSTAVHEALTAAGVTAGILDDVVTAFGDGVELTQIICVARGVQAVPGTDATLEYHFDTNPQIVPAQRADGGVDYHAALVERFVPEGAVLATRHPGVAGVAGHDVLGTVLEPPAVKDIDLTLFTGTNTAIEDDTLVATITGRPVLKHDIEVLPIFEVSGDLDYTVGNIDFMGDVTVKGDVRPGFTIVASGSVVVGGLVEGCAITAGKDLSVGGTVGEHPSQFEVGGDLNARYLHNTQAHVGGDITVAREIMNCTLTANRISTGTQGRIVGGTITAVTEVDCGTLGSHGDAATRVAVTSGLPTATVRARKTACAGVIIDLGATRREVRSDLDSVSFWEAEAGVIVSLRATADEAAAAEARTPPPAAA